MLNNNIDFTILVNKFNSNKFFPHYRFKNFLDKNIAVKVSEEISDSFEHAKPYYVYNVKKFALTDSEHFGSTTYQLINYLNSKEFIGKLEDISGIKNLLGDDMLEGGGLHFSKKGGYLKVHADFESHIVKKSWKRRLNLLIYFNKNWREENNGGLSLYSEDLNNNITYMPDFNSAVLFRTDSKSWHGHPELLKPPAEDPIRKSIAMYYYTEEGKELELKETNFKSLKTDNVRIKFLMAFDQFLLRTFSYLKRKNFISDKIVTTFIGFFVKKKK